MEDINPILGSWPYEPGEITVRKIVGGDGNPYIQLRLDLGLLQMAMTGRPDGRRPFGADCLLEFHQERLERHRAKTGGDDGFTLTAKECAELRDESIQYYRRYLGLYHLEEFEGVVRDTSRNLDCLDFMRQYAADESDRAAFEQYRAYIIMMHTRALTALALESEDFPAAVQAIGRGIDRIEGFLREIDQPDLIGRSLEIASLRQLEQEIRRRMPLDPVDELRQQLQAAVEVEDYELAAVLRDQLRELDAVE